MSHHRPSVGFDDEDYLDPLYSMEYYEEGEEEEKEEEIRDDDGPAVGLLEQLQGLQRNATAAKGVGGGSSSAKKALTQPAEGLSKDPTSSSTSNDHQHPMSQRKIYRASIGSTFTHISPPKKALDFLLRDCWVSVVCFLSELDIMSLSRVSSELYLVAHDETAWFWRVVGRADFFPRSRNLTGIARRYQADYSLGKTAIVVDVNPKLTNAEMENIWKTTKPGCSSNTPLFRRTFKFKFHPVSSQSLTYTVPTLGVHAQSASFRTNKWQSDIAKVTASLQPLLQTCLPLSTAFAFKLVALEYRKRILENLLQGIQEEAVKTFEPSPFGTAATCAKVSKGRQPSSKVNKKVYAPKYIDPYGIISLGRGACPGATKIPVTRWKGSLDRLHLCYWKESVLLECLGSPDQEKHECVLRDYDGSVSVQRKLSLFDFRFSEDAVFFQQSLREEVAVIQQQIHVVLASYWRLVHESLLQGSPARLWAQLQCNRFGGQTAIALQCFHALKKLGKAKKCVNDEEGGDGSADKGKGDEEMTHEKDEEEEDGALFPCSKRALRLLEIPRCQNDIDDFECLLQAAALNEAKKEQEAIESPTQSAVDTTTLPFHFYRPTQQRRKFCFK